MAHPVRLFKYSTSGPDDTTALERLRDEEGFEADDIMAVVGKSEGNGCVNECVLFLSQSLFTT